MDTSDYEALEKKIPYLNKAIHQIELRNLNSSEHTMFDLILAS